AGAGPGHCGPGAVEAGQPEGAAGQAAQEGAAGRSTREQFCQVIEAVSVHAASFRRRPLGSRPAGSLALAGRGADSFGAACVAGAPAQAAVLVHAGGPAPAVGVARAIEVGRAAEAGDAGGGGSVGGRAVGVAGAGVPGAPVLVEVADRVALDGGPAGAVPVAA